MKRPAPWIIPLLLVVGAASHAPAQDRPESDRTASVAGSMEVAAHLWAVIGRYRFAATADRVRVTLFRPGGRSDMHTLDIRCVPGPSGMARLDMRDLSVEARAGVLKAVHGRDPTTFALVPAPDDAATPAATLRALLPPLPIPHLSLAFDEDAVDWSPLISGLEWEQAERTTGRGWDGVRLLGSSDLGKASLELAGARIRRFEADLDPSGQTRVLVECEPLDPSDPDSWPLDLGGRRELPRLSLLRPLGPPLRLGDALPRLEPQPIGQSQAPAPVVPAENDGLPPTAFSALLLIRAAPAEEVEPVLRQAFQGYAAAAREILRDRLDGLLDKRTRLTGLAGVVESETDAETLESLERLHAVWSTAADQHWSAPAPPPALGWVTAEQRLLDRLAPQASAALLLHDAAGRIHALVPLDQRAVTDAVSAALADAVRKISPP